jgi:hypothetical protein
MAHGTTHGITMLGWSDYVGLIRCRAVPTHQLEARLEHGLGWAVAGQALTPFAELAPNPWGPMAEVRQVPDPPPTLFCRPTKAGPRSTFICAIRATPMAPPGSAARGASRARPSLRWSRVLGCGSSVPLSMSSP